MTSPPISSLRSTSSLMLTIVANGLQESSQSELGSPIDDEHTDCEDECNNCVEAQASRLSGFIDSMVSYNHREILQSIICYLKNTTPASYSRLGVVADNLESESAASMADAIKKHLDFLTRWNGTLQQQERDIRKICSGQFGGGLDGNMDYSDDEEIHTFGKEFGAGLGGYMDDSGDETDVSEQTLSDSDAIATEDDTICMDDQVSLV